MCFLVFMFLIHFLFISKEKILLNGGCGTQQKDPRFGSQTNQT